MGRGVLAQAGCQASGEQGECPGGGSLCLQLLSMLSSIPFLNLSSQTNRIASSASFSGAIAKELFMSPRDLGSGYPEPFLDF